MMDRLSSREKITVLGGGFFFLVFIVVQFIYLPAYDQKADLQNVLAAKIEALDKIRLLEKEYRSLKPSPDKDSGFIQKRDRKFTLFSFIDQQTSGTGIKNNIDYMQPSKKILKNSDYDLSSVKLKLKKIVLKEFLIFLKKVESEEGIRITYLLLDKSGKEKKFLDAVIEVQTLTPKGKKI